ncbi:MAG: hypothetical protein KAW13_00420 [Dehalococcoidia bacterium]|nr:hypothetical protein [Dehalococcoidia bacterium]
MAYYTCYYCGHFGNDVTRVNEHPYPQRSGGVTTVDACHLCNSQKGGKTAHQFARWLSEHPEQMRPGVPYPDSDRRRFVRRMLNRV